MEHYEEFINIKKAFKKVKEDNLFLLQKIEILEEQMKSQKREFSQAFELLQEKLELEQAAKELNKKATKVSTPKKAVTQKFRANTDSKLLHTMTCPFGKRVKDEHTAFFKSITKAHEEGYSLCSCLKEY